jgi:sugar transferase (PEP-CTERM/EpsH1 system associated)
MVDLVDVDSQKWLDYARTARWPRRILYGLEGRRLRRLEQGLPGWTRAVMLTTAAEAQLFESFAGPGSATVVNNGVDLDYFRPGSVTAADVSSSAPCCAFVGALDYPPNVDAACWFCTEAWPAVRARRPESKVYLVGRRPVPAVRRLAAVPGVEVIGAVADVRPWLARATVVVVPLRIARGIQNKLLEALAMGCAVVASPTCLAGLGARSGAELWSASAAVEWSENVLALFDDGEERRRLGKAGRAYVERHHHWDRCLEPLGKLLTRERLAARRHGADN